MVHDNFTGFLRLSTHVALTLGITLALPARAALYSQTFEGEVNTLAQRGAVQVEAAGHGITFRLDNTAFLTERTLGGLAVNFVPTALNITAITVYDFEVALTQENLETSLATISGEKRSVNATTIERGKKDSVTFVTNDGLSLRGTPVTFFFPEGTALNTDTTYTLTFNFAKATMPVLLGFTNATTTADFTREDFLFTGGVASTHAPHIAFKGTAFANRFVLALKEKQEANLSDLLKAELKDGKDFSGDYDLQDTVVVVNLQSGARLTLDQPMARASFVGASFAETQPLLSPEAETFPPTLIFQKDVEMKGPFSLRGGTGSGAGAETVVGAPMVANICLAGDTSAWDPKDFILRTDLRAECFFPTDRGWFLKNPLVIASGRRVVRAAPGESGNPLPLLNFEAADSTLVLARPALEGEDIPERFREAFRGSSGTLYLARNATLGEDTAGGSGVLTVGQNGLTHTFGLLTEGKTLAMANAVPLVLGDGKGASGTFHQHAGTVTLNNVTLSQNEATLGRFLQDAGTANMEAVSFPATGEVALFRVGDGAGAAETAIVSANSLTDGAGAGTVNVEILPDGRLEVGALSLSNGSQRSMSLHEGTLAAQKGKEVKVNAGSAGIRIMNGGTLDGNGGTLTIATVTGEGNLTAKGNVTLGTLQDYTGEISHTREDDGLLTLEAITGASGTVTLGYLGYRTADGKDNDAAALVAITQAAANYHGTLAFGEEVKILDFSDLRDVVTFPYAIAFSNEQSITMRLDQYADATIRWPEDPRDITLTLIEAGAYGGVAEIPHVPTGVNIQFYFKRYKGDGTAELGDTPYERTPSENGVTDTLTWENPLFTGKSAWIDCEFNGNSKNTGWFTLMGRTESETDPTLYNGLLLGNGTNHGASQVLLDVSSRTADAVWFVDAQNPLKEQGAVQLAARPYVALPSLLYPEAWSVALRFTTPDKANKCLLAVGANVFSESDRAHDNLKDFPQANLNTLLLTTGDNGNDLRLYYVTGNAGVASARQVAQAKLANATLGAYVLSVVCDGTRMVIYLNGAYLADYAPQGGIRLGPGLQVGAMLGGQGLVNDALWGMFSPVEQGDGGTIDYLRFYKGALSDTAKTAMANETPHIVRNVRFVRDLPGDSNLWVDPERKPWRRQVYTDGAWKDEGSYAEPDAGTEVRLRVTENGEHLLQVNVRRDVNTLFYSADRTYATLVVEPQEGAIVAGTVRLVPFGVTSSDYETEETTWTTNNTWYTEREADGTFAYGILRFTGGAGAPICDDPTSPLYGTGYLSPSREVTTDEVWGDYRDATAWVRGGWTSGGYLYQRTVYRTKTVTAEWAATDMNVGVNAIFDSGICWFSPLAPLCLKASTNGKRIVEEVYSYLEEQTSQREPNTRIDQKKDYGVATLVSSREVSSEEGTPGPQPNSLTLVAGLSLTRGVEEEAKTWQLTGPITVEGTVAEGRDAVAGNVGVSQDVWVASPRDTAKWTFFDQTLTKAENANGATRGLFAQGVQTPGRLYLDLTHAETATQYEANNAFSTQRWYRYGYPGTPAADTLSGMTPVPASESDFKQVVAFQIKLGNNAGLTLDAVPEATVRTFYVEPSDSTTEVPTLTLRSSRDTRLGITKSVVAAARLNVANETGVDDALNLAEGVEIHRGGTAKGAYIVGKQDFAWPLDASSVPSVEVSEGGTLTFSAAQDLHNHQVAIVAHPGATVALLSAATSLRAASLTLAENTTFRFEEAKALFDGAVWLNGSAIVEGTGGNGWLAAVGGIVGTKEIPTLTVSAPENAQWRLYGGVGDLALTKAGAGTVDLPEASPPSVTGKVEVQAGTLLVGTERVPAADTHDGPAVGHHGLHVAAGATLARTEAAAADGVIACIPDGQTLSGAGTIEGFLRLYRGAVYDGTRGIGLTVAGVVTGTSGKTDIEVCLPEDYAEDTPFLTALREERSVRRRLLSKIGTETWNTKGVIDRTNAAVTKTFYSATKPSLPLPAYDEELAWGGPEGNVYDANVAGALIASHRRADVASVSSVEGYTKAKTYGLNATEISNAYLCFNGVWAFAPDGDATAQREVLDSSTLCMAYEFGVSRLTISAMTGIQETLPSDIRTDEQGRPLYVVVEASLRQSLTTCFGFAEGSDAATQTASFAPGVSLKLYGRYENEGEMVELTAIALDAFDGKPLQGSAPSGGRVRWFAIPYSESNFPMGTIPITVRAIAPSNQE